MAIAARPWAKGSAGMRGAFGRRGVRADAAGQLSFDRVDAVVGSSTTAIQARDLNGDGRLDLVVSAGQSVFVLTGRGDGRFDVTWSGAAGENPVDLAIADLDEDGLADLAVANHETDYVTRSSGSPEGLSNTGSTQDSVSMSRRTRTPFDCTTSTPMATRTFWSTTGRPSPSGCSGVAGMAHSRGQHRSTSAVIRTGA